MTTVTFLRSGRPTKITDQHLQETLQSVTAAKWGHTRYCATHRYVTLDHSSQ